MSEKTEPRECLRWASGPVVDRLGFVLLGSVADCVRLSVPSRWIQSCGPPSPKLSRSWRRSRPGSGWRSRSGRGSTSARTWTGRRSPKVPSALLPLPPCLQLAVSNYSNPHPRAPTTVLLAVRLTPATYCFCLHPKLTGKNAARKNAHFPCY